MTNIVCMAVVARVRIPNAFIATFSRNSSREKCKYLTELFWYSIFIRAIYIKFFNMFK